MEQWRDQSKRFSESDGKWSDVRSSLHRAADDVYREWESDLKALEQSCADLRKGAQHPKVEEALKQLAAFSQGRDQIIKEAEGFLDAAANLLNGADKDTDDRDIADALAKANDVEGSLSKLTYASNDASGPRSRRWPAHIAAARWP
jgi:ABC-type transporter Mla subunit MlaD